MSLKLSLKNKSLWLCLLCFAIASASVGCKQTLIKKDYARPLKAKSGLRLLSVYQWPNISNALTSKKGFNAAAERSLKWFSISSTQKFFPMDGITHDQARASVFAFARLRQRPGVTPGQIQAEFNCYTSVGWDGSGDVLFTGYYSPIYKGSRKRFGKYQYPLYKRPKDLVTDPRTGKILGHPVNGVMTQYPPRKQIQEQQLLKGTELIWLANPHEVYNIHVQGSARIDLVDEQKTIFIGYSGNNGHEYKSIGLLLLKNKALGDQSLSFTAIQKFFKKHPEQLKDYTNQNPRFIFFREYPGENWPAGSLGFKVSSFRSIATAKTVYPRGGVVLVDTLIAFNKNHKQRIMEFMLDQDTGGAFKAAGKADIFIGVGHQAEQIAGRQYQEGRLYYFFLKKSRVAYWLNQMKMER